VLSDGLNGMLRSGFNNSFRNRCVDNFKSGVTNGLEGGFAPEPSDPKSEAVLEQIADLSPASEEDGSLPTITSAENFITAALAATSSETVNAEKLQTPPEDETRTEHEVSAIPSLAPPASNPGVPLQNEPAQRPDSGDIPETHFELPPVAYVPTDEFSEVPVLAEVRQAVPLPSASSITPPKDWDKNGIGLGFRASDFWRGYRGGGGEGNRLADLC
jgi:hypothetical protein